MRIVFFGTSPFGIPTLQALADRHEVVLVVSQPDRPSGRGRKLQPTPIRAAASELGLPVFQPESVNAAESLERLRETQADIGVVIAYGQFIREPVRSLYPLNCVNLHGSVLPRWRGAAPINWAILAGDATTGVTIFELVDRMDAGPVLLDASTPIEENETAAVLHDRLSVFGVEPTLRAIEGRFDGSITPTPQPETGATHARKLTKADGDLAFDRPAREVANRVHGLWSWPGARAVFVHGESGDRTIVTLAQVEPVSLDGGEPPGTLLDGGVIACADGGVRVRSLKPAQRGQMDWAAFANGQRIVKSPAGSRFEPVPTQESPHA